MEEEMNHFGLNMEAGICIFHVTIKRKSLAKKKKKGKEIKVKVIQFPQFLKIACCPLRQT